MPAASFKFILARSSSTCLRSVAFFVAFGLCVGTLANFVQGQQTTANIEAYQGRILAAAESETSELQSLVELPPVPAQFQPWWHGVLGGQLQTGTNEAVVDLESLILRTLDYSAQVKVFSDLPLIRKTAIVEANAAFDWNQFLRTRWDDLSDPVGNILTTGGSPRYRNNQWTGSGGMNRRNHLGGRVEVAQDFGFQNTNSTFFQPNDQGTSRLRLSYVQPLMRGRGKVYNTSLIVLAKIDAAVAEDEFSRQLQSHLLEVTRAYWSLYLERVALVQKQHLYLRAEEILQELQARSRVDVVGSQIVRAEAAVTERRGDLVRAEAAVRNAQERIHALVNDPNLSLVPNLEMVPIDIPARSVESFQMDEVLYTALQMRPEVNQALKQIKAACIRLNMSKNELLPQLDLIFDSYVAGLRGDSNVGGAWLDQFSTGEPGYSVGLQYSMPRGNRAAKARLQRRQLEFRQLQNQFRATVETLLMEVKVAAREVRTSERESRAKYYAMLAASKRLENIQARWEHLPGQESTVGLYLDNVLTAQQQLADSEFEFAKSETTYNLALMNLKRATGTLLQHEKIVEGVGCIDGLPTKTFDKDSTVDNVDPNWLIESSRNPKFDPRSLSPADPNVTHTAEDIHGTFVR